ncbi:MAG: ATP-binding protein [Desulfobacterales bacterium]|nr:ATP-binding protein [Desulfobacterales bacterium]
MSINVGLVEKETISITVSDDGPGLKPEDADKVFDPFFTRQKTMGMGVGLSICYGIVEDHQGSLECNPA